MSLYYRGVLSSCNYACDYCPFAKTKDSKETLKRDEKQLFKFVDWVEQLNKNKNKELNKESSIKTQILITPWGEALIRKHYQEALKRLASFDHVNQVSIQTNLSGSFDWLSNLPENTRKKIALWCTFHPTQTTLAHFVSRCDELRSLGVSHSVGMVAIHDDLPLASALRLALPLSTFMWLNAVNGAKKRAYSEAELSLCRQIDPTFDFSVTPSKSLGKPCRAGSESLSIDEHGDVRRCHFLPEILGNIETHDLDEMCAPRLCAKLCCDCFIGYSQRRDLPLFDYFQPNLMARIAPENKIKPINQMR